MSITKTPVLMLVIGAFSFVLCSCLGSFQSDCSSVHNGSISLGKSNRGGEVCRCVCDCAYDVRVKVRVTDFQCVFREVYLECGMFGPVRQSG